MLQLKVSIVVPVYRAEKYIERCVRSLFEQTLDDIEYIFVDDHSPDKSIFVIKGVLEEYPARKSQVRILVNERNMGVGQTRQRGIDEATGEYIIHCDPDDWVDRDMYESMYTKAKETNADIVVCDFTEEYDGHANYIKQTISKSKKSLFHQITTGLVHSSLWNKLVRSTIAKKIRISPGINLWEDMSVIPCMFMESDKIEKINSALYHYYKANSTSVTHENRYVNSLSSIKAIVSLTSYLETSGHLNDIDIWDLYKLQFSAKRGLLTILSKDNLDLWNRTFSEASNYYLKIGLSIKSKILTYLAINHHLRILKLYDKIYGL